MILLCGAPVSEDVPADAVVAEPREEIQGAMGGVADFFREDHYQAFCDYAAWRA